MKFSPFSLLLLLCFNVYSQTSFIQTKAGEKIEFAKNSIQILVNDKQVGYKTTAGASKQISFKEIKEAFFGSYKFKYFNFLENKNNYCYFVLAESNDLSLIFIGVPDADSDEDVVSSRFKYEMFVLNKFNVVVDMVVFSNEKNDKGRKGRSEVQDIIVRNFGKCQELNDRFAEFERSNEAQFMGVLGFFKEPIFIKCQ